MFDSAARVGGSDARLNHLVTDETQTDVNRSRIVKIERIDGVAGIAAKLVPRVGLSENGLGQALGAVTAVELLGDFEYQLGHTITLSPSRGSVRGSVRDPVRENPGVVLSIFLRKTHVPAHVLTSRK